MTNQRHARESASPSGSGLVRFNLPRPAILAIALGVLTLALLAPALGGNYLWDDTALIRDNALVHSFEHWTQWFSRSLFATGPDATEEARGAQYFRPLVLFSFAADHWLGGTNPAMGHATNLLLYAACILSAYATLRRWHATTLGTLVGITWFALHPTHVECAAWISGRTDLLAFLGILLATYGASRRLAHRPRYIAFELLGTLIAYGSKEIAIVLPAFYAVEIWVSRGRPPIDRPTLLIVLRQAFPQLLIACLYLGARLLWLPLWTAAMATEPSLPLLTRVGLLLETCGRATALTLLPWPLRGQHGLIARSAFGQTEFVPGYVTLGALAILLLLVTFVRFRRRAPAAVMAVFLAAFCFVPVSNLAPSRLQCLLFERYLFIPHLAIAWLLAQALDARTRRITWALVPFVLGAFAWLTHERALDYADSERFWNHELKYNPKSSVAASSLADLPQYRASPGKVIRMLSRCYDSAASRREFSDANGCLFRMLVILGRSTPDAQVNTLHAVADELRLLLSGEIVTKARPAIDSPLGSFRFGLDPAQVKQIEKHQPGRIEAELAVLHSRLNEPETAVKYAQQSLSQCSGCSWSAPLALVFANVYDYAKARQVLDTVRAKLGDLEVAPFDVRLNESENLSRIEETATGPALIHARAQRLLALSRYGQAYALLLPVKDQFLAVPEVALGYAQIAYFAGYDNEAKSTLALHLSPDQVTSTLQQWREELPMIR